MSLIDLNNEEFCALYEQGALFLYHAFSEGVLLDGSEAEWRQLGAGFHVAASFREEIAEYVGLLGFVLDYPGYDDTPIPLLSNLFKALKNIAVFELAERGKYQFDKERALAEHFAFTDIRVQALLAAYNSFERSLTSPSWPSHKLAAVFYEWRPELVTLHEELASAH